jgi:hypothetical protein
VLLQEHTYFLRRGALYGRWRVHGKEGHTHLWSFFLRRGALKLSAHLSLEGGTLERRELQQGKSKGKQGLKAQAKERSKQRHKERGPKVS